MKKLHLLLLIIAAVCLQSKAQSTQIATLCHEGEITIFTGGKAFIEAYDAATDGDVITLSAGQFEAKRNIEKNITVRGNGMYGAESTIFTGSVDVSGNKSIDPTAGTVQFEGIAFNSDVRNNRDFTTFLKCYIPGFFIYNAAKVVHCDITHPKGTAGALTGAFTGCYINGTLKNASIENCIVISNENNSKFSDDFFKNSIFLSDIGGTFPKTCSFANCIYLGNADALVNCNIVTDTQVFPADTEFLKEGTQTFELLDELQTTWLGSDGTQVGMHGGSFPFDPTTTNPKIQSFNVSAKTSADGKLAVDIVVDVK